MIESAQNLNIEFSPKLYPQRRKSLFRWHFFGYLIIVFFAEICSGYDTPIGNFLFLLPLFIINFQRQLRWIKYTLLTLNTDENGINLTYFKREVFISRSIGWEELSVHKGSTFTNSPNFYLKLKEGEITIASFYSDHEARIDNAKVVEMYRSLKSLIMAYNQLHNIKTPFKFQVEDAIQKQSNFILEIGKKQTKKAIKFVKENW